MQDSLVSIITPAYNAEKFIAETIESVLNQTYQNWEMIIVNDCSKDDTEKIVQSYILKDKRIRLINLENNGGVASARNVAIKNAKGRYIAFLDSDDLWIKEKLQKQIGFMRKNGYVFTYTSYQHFKENILFAKQAVEILLEITYRQALKGNQIGCLTVILDREQIANIEFSKERHEDYRLWLSILKQGIKAYGINESLAYYRTGSSKSISGNKFRSAIWTWNVYYKNQKLGLFRSIYYFINYTVKGMMKYKF